MSLSITLIGGPTALIEIDASVSSPIRPSTSPATINCRM